MIREEELYYLILYRMIRGNNYKNKKSETGSIVRRENKTDRKDRKKEKICIMSTNHSL